MLTKLTHALIVLLLSVAITSPLHAQTSAFIYQGRLTENGSPANGNFDIVTELWNAPAGGAPPGTAITNTAVAVSNGLFAVTLDFGPGVFDGNERWLEIGVATNGSGVFMTLDPRQQITSTPYAVRAANAASAMTVAGSGITGTIGLAQLPAVVVTNGASGVNISGAFSGNGARVTNVSITTLNSYGLLLPGTFSLVSSPGVGGSPYSVTAADVNGDGRVDLISANYTSSGTLTVLTNDGSGGFVLASSPGVGNRPISVTTADINGDGRVDLISANYASSGTLTVLTNDGSGGFVFSSSPGVGSNPRSVTAADVNGDGKLDLVSANAVADTLTVLFNVPVYSGSFSGDGSGLRNLNLNAANITGTLGSSQIPDLDALKITTGTLADARLSANVALLNRTPQAFTGTNTFAGRVGIGTTTPKQALHNAGDYYGRGHLWLTSNGGDGADGVAYVQARDDSGTSSIAMRLRTQSAGSLVEAVHISTNGNVGIGTVNPTNKLDVAGNVSGTTFITTSDRNAKENFIAISPADVLAG